MIRSGIRGWGWRNRQHIGEEGFKMGDSRTIEDRRAALLDQLENPLLTQVEIDKIKHKLEILDSQNA